MIIKAESHKLFSEIYCPIMPAPLELFFGDGCRSENVNCCTHYNFKSTLDMQTGYNGLIMHAT